MISDWVTGKEIVDAGQHEMLNWFCLAGAMRELGLPLTWSAFAASDVFNSNKCFAVFGDDNSKKPAAVNGGKS